MITFLIVVGAILEIIVLVCFFRLCANVKSLRASLEINTNDVSISDSVHMLIELGKKDEAKDMVIKDIIIYINKYKAENADAVLYSPAILDNINDILKKELHKKYDGIMQAVDLDYTAFDRLIGTQKNNSVVAENDVPDSQTHT